jgi:hypothetical protein
MGSEDATGRGLPHSTSVVAEPSRGVNGERIQRMWLDERDRPGLAVAQPRSDCK